MENKFDKIRKSGYLLYEYIRGSEAYGTALPKDSEINAVSDIDTGGVFYSDLKSLMSLYSYYNEQINDEKNDNVWYELGRFIDLLLKSNPNMLESLWIPKRCILFESDIMKELKEHRDLFLSRNVYNTFGGYATSQIKKARGLNKAIVNPISKRLSVIDFVYTFLDQGSTKIENWLSNRGMMQQYCGLVSVPNMHEIYGLYYDFIRHINNEYGNKVNFIFIIRKKLEDNDWIKSLIDKVTHKGKHIECDKDAVFFHSVCHRYGFSTLDILFGDSDFEKLASKIEKDEEMGFCGIMSNEKEENESNQLRLSSVPKGIKPLCNISFNVFGYKKHCSDYKRYQTWLHERNPNRYELNKKSNYDVKNMYHMFRLVHMCTEILEGKGVNIDRSNIDRDFLMKIRFGEFAYEELMEICEKDKKEMDYAYLHSELSDDVDKDKANELLVTLRSKLYFKV